MSIFSFLKTDLNKILGVFHRTIAKLEAHAEAKAQEVVQHVADSELSTQLAQAAAAEQAKAASVVQKLKALL